jgi:hypothetical protein
MVKSRCDNDDEEDDDDEDDSILSDLTDEDFSDDEDNTVVNSGFKKDKENNDKDDENHLKDYKNSSKDEDGMDDIGVRRGVSIVQGNRRRSPAARWLAALWVGCPQSPPAGCSRVGHGRPE